MEKFFSVFGKVILVVLVLGGAAGAAFYYGRQTAQPGEPNSIETAVDTATPTLAVQSGTPSAAPASGTTVSAGVPASGGLLFDTYTVIVPAGWTYTHDQDISVPVDTLTISKGNYSIKIFQAATGGAMCLYPSDAPFEGPSSTYDTYKAITTADATQLRRSGTTAASGTTRGFTVCQKAPDGTFQQPTHYGHMQYTTPLTPDSAILIEMDTIVASFKES